MTERLNYIIYKITNSCDDMVYIGSTRLKLRDRFNCHKNEAKKGNKKIHKYMREKGIENFKIEIIKEIIVPKSKIAKIQEQIYLWEIPPEKRLNDMRAYTHNSEKTRDNDKKKKTRMNYYNKKKLDPVWHEKEKERNRLRMQKKRQLARNSDND